MDTAAKEAAGLDRVVLGHLPAAFRVHAGSDALAWAEVCERVPVRRRPLLDFSTAFRG